jgi:hypothetical protein
MPSLCNGQTKVKHDNRRAKPPGTARSFGHLCITAPFLLFYKEPQPFARIHIIKRATACRSGCARGGGRRRSAARGAAARARGGRRQPP